MGTRHPSRRFAYPPIAQIASASDFRRASAFAAVMPAQAGIQYAAAAMIKPHRLDVLDRPVQPGDDN
ncbi:MULTISPECIES: hypothetical protein [unclassified Bradyrhizobium]|uniref:hypothetical protein n=1 Tax=unclassified Bradyrhizobium TaxID=2631580 RepID=UPI0028E82772|nr:MULTISPECIES: hypothetical protein [unclassified Bradyrhizobium]